MLTAGARQVVPHEAGPVGTDGLEAEHPGLLAAGLVARQARQIDGLGVQKMFKPAALLQIPHRLRKMLGTYLYFQSFSMLRVFSWIYFVI